MFSLIEMHGRCTAENLSNAVIEYFRHEHYPVVKIVGLTADEASVMVGHNQQGAFYKA